MHVALGFRAHSGWAALVVAGGTLDSPVIVQRRRIVIADPSLRGSKQPYHAAAELPSSNAESFVKAAVDSSRALAVEAIEAALKELRSRGHQAAACGVLLGSPRELPPLDRILASHAMIHTAEGRMFRDVLLWAANQSGLPPVAIPEKQIDPVSLSRIQTLGKLIGPPWTQDQKLAAIAALEALRTRARSAVR